MFFHTMVYKTPEALYGRLTQVEKIDLRRASPDRIDFLFHDHYRTEIETVADLAKVKEMCDKDMADYDALTNLLAHSGYIPSTWRF